MIDQPTIITNHTGQRPVENIVGSLVSRRYGGMQPANISRAEMFGPAAPVWPFLKMFGGAADFNFPAGSAHVYETYPVLTMIALEWVLPDTRPCGRLPKYNPARKKTFTKSDWKYVCGSVCASMTEHKLHDLVAWLEGIAEKDRPTKKDQDCLDACMCLLVAIHHAMLGDCLVVGNFGTGYIMVPDSETLRDELKLRCDNTAKSYGEWVRTIGRTP